MGWEAGGGGEMEEQEGTERGGERGEMQDGIMGDLQPLPLLKPQQAMVQCIFINSCMPYNYATIFCTAGSNGPRTLSQSGSK